MYLRIIIVLNMEVVESKAVEMIGDPEDLNAGGEQQASLPNPRPGPGLGGVQQQQPTARVSAPYASGVIPGVSKGTTKNEAGVGHGQQGQQQNTFGRFTAVYQPAPVYDNRGPIDTNEAPARIIPIAALNPHQGRWTIRVLITAKSDVRRFHNAQGQGRVCSFDVLDADGGEIRATCFNNAVEQLYNRVEVGKVYLISKGSLRAAQKEQSHLRNHWEIFLGPQTTIERCHDEGSSIVPPLYQVCNSILWTSKEVFDFKPISDVETLENNALIDIIGVVVSIDSTITILPKNGIETLLRSLRMMDCSGESVYLEIWGVYCNEEGLELPELLQEYLWQAGKLPVLEVKSAGVSDCNGKLVSSISSTQFFLYPDHPEAHKLREWIEGGGDCPNSGGGQGGSGFGGGGSGYGGGDSTGYGDGGGAPGGAGIWYLDDWGCEGFL
jgi:replication factor A1